MPGPISTFDNSFGNTGLLDKVTDLENIDRLAMVNSNTCCEKILQNSFPFCICLCRRKYNFNNVEPGYGLGDITVFKLVETSCCCPNEWTLYSAATDEKLMVYTRKDACFPLLRACCGGPGFDIHDFKDGVKGTYYGDVNHPACQCCDGGFDVRDAEPRRKYFVGNVCQCCSPGLHPVPVWNDEKNEIVNYNMHVIPACKRFCPCICCCMRSFWVVDFPKRSTKIDKVELMAGGLLQQTPF
jgi:hypothetical protein